MIALATLCSLSGMTRTYFYHLRPLLKTEIGPTTNGRATMLSRQNCFEIWLLKELLAANIPRQFAFELCRRMLRLYGTVQLPHWLVWDRSRSFFSLCDEISQTDQSVHFDAINIRSIVTAIDKVAA